ncbi:MAG: DinB family protein [Candidatus Sulfotelmatobacter sp.]
MSQRAQLELLHGQGAHADPIGCVEDLSADLAAQQVPHFPHSVAALVFHMNYWMDYELRRIRGHRPAYPEHNAESFPSYPASIDAAEWDRLRKGFITLLSEFTALAKSPPEELHRQLESIHPGDANRAGTLEAVIWQMVSHNSYHAGQIAMIRRVLNAWPPKSGGDTW